jgi:DNA-binding LytR/AlgR family response regulator
MFVYGIAVHLYDFFRLRKDAQKLRFEKQEAELAYLKSQTNPHFLFNTLNNIYSLARDKSDLAPASILRLSALLRFMLYECNAPAAAVHKELKIIEDYIELERLRYDETLRITQNYQVDDMNEQLPPLLLVPLVENAFKHGVSESRAHPFVEIHLAIKNKRLTFTVRNSVDEQAHGIGVREGIGLANLRRQLELLFNEYKLDLHSANGVFTVIMTINLASHVEHNLHHIEDEPLAAKVLTDYIHQTYKLRLVGSFRDAIAASEYLHNHDVDLLFLDIHLPRLKGLDFLKTLASPPAVIITTAYHQYAVDGFNLNATDYLLKPIEFERFLTAVNKVVRTVRDKDTGNEREYIFVTMQQKKIKIMFAEILYIESQKEYIRIVTTKRALLVKMSTAEIEKLLPPSMFRRIHRSFIVSLPKIDAYNAEHVEINGVSIPIGKGFKDSLEDF